MLFFIGTFFRRSRISVRGIVIEQEAKDFHLNVLDKGCNGVGPLIDLFPNADEIVHFESDIVSDSFQGFQVVILFVIRVAFLDQLAEKEVEKR